MSSFPLCFAPASLYTLPAPSSLILEVDLRFIKIFSLICLQFLQFINHTAQPFRGMHPLLSCCVIHMVSEDNLRVIYALSDLASGVESDPQSSGVDTMCVGESRDKVLLEEL